MSILKLQQHTDGIWLHILNQDGTKADANLENMFEGPAYRKALITAMGHEEDVKQYLSRQIELLALAFGASPAQPAEQIVLHAINVCTIMEKALDSIACWENEPEPPSSGYDEPGSAAMAREAIREVRKLTEGRKPVEVPAAAKPAEASFDSRDESLELLALRSQLASARGNEESHRAYAHLMQEQRSKIAEYCSLLEKQIEALKPKSSAT